MYKTNSILSFFNHRLVYTWLHNELKGNRFIFTWKHQWHFFNWPVSYLKNRCLVLSWQRNWWTTLLNPGDELASQCIAEVLDSSLFTFSSQNHCVNNQLSSIVVSSNGVIWYMINRIKYITAFFTVISSLEDV